MRVTQGYSTLFIASALQSFALGAGHSVEVPHYVRSWPLPTRVSRRIKRNEENESVWRATGPTQGRCIWEMHGVWDWDEGNRVAVALRENYFKIHPITHRPVRWHLIHWCLSTNLFAHHSSTGIRTSGILSYPTGRVELPWLLALINSYLWKAFPMR